MLMEPLSMDAIKDVIQKLPYLCYIGGIILVSHEFGGKNLGIRFI